MCDTNGANDNANGAMAAGNGMPFADPEGTPGIYFGPVDSQGRPHGLGRLVYNDQREGVFYGDFKDGRMLAGAVDGDRFTELLMNDGRWSYPRPSPEQRDAANECAAAARLALEVAAERAAAAKVAQESPIFMPN